MKRTGCPISNPWTRCPALNWGEASVAGREGNFLTSAQPVKNFSLRVDISVELVELFIKGGILVTF